VLVVLRFATELYGEAPGVTTVPWRGCVSMSGSREWSRPGDAGGGPGAAGGIISGAPEMVGCDMKIG